MNQWNKYFCLPTIVLQDLSFAIFIPRYLLASLLCYNSGFSLVQISHPGLVARFRNVHEGHIQSAAFACKQRKKKVFYNNVTLAQIYSNDDILMILEENKLCIFS